jgi:hypothetical protein
MRQFFVFCTEENIRPLHVTHDTMVRYTMWLASREPSPRARYNPTFRSSKSFSATIINLHWLLASYSLTHDAAEKFARSDSLQRTRDSPF